MTTFLPQPLQCCDSRCEQSQPSVPVPSFTLSLCVDSVTPCQPPHQCFSVSVCLRPSPTLSVPVSVSLLLLYLDFPISFPASLCLYLPFCPHFPSLSLYLSPVSVAPQSLPAGPQMFSSGLRVVRGRTLHKQQPCCCKAAFISGQEFDTVGQRGGHICAACQEHSQEIPSGRQQEVPNHRVPVRENVAPVQGVATVTTYPPLTAQAVHPEGPERLRSRAGA